MARLLCGLVAALLALLAPLAEARIGDTEAELVARFGSVLKRGPERMLEAGRIFVVGERIALEQREWRVTAVLIDGQCAKIMYAKAGKWTDQQQVGWLAANAGRWAWREIAGGAPKWQRTWRRADGLVAKWRYAGGFVIEAQPYVDARARIRGFAEREPVATRHR